MAEPQDLETLEAYAYRASTSDGVVDVFVGVSLVYIGAVWIWLPDLAGFAGVLPAVFVAAMMTVRRRIVEPRTGYVRWGEPRRRWERRNAAAVAAFGVVLFLTGVAAFVIVAGGSVDTDVVSQVMPGLLAWLLAIVAIGLGFLMGIRRMLAYAVVLAAAGIVAMRLEANPGWPLLTAGAVIAVAGVALLVRFLRRNPVAAS